MTQHVPPIPSIRLSPLRRGKGWLVGLVLAVAIIATGTVLLVSSDSGTSTSSRAVSTSVSGPNETLRGSAVATAAANHPLAVFGEWVRKNFPMAFSVVGGEFMSGSGNRFAPARIEAFGHAANHEVEDRRQ